MLRPLAATGLLLAAAVLAGGAAPTAVAAVARGDVGTGWVQQAGTYDALSTGDFDGEVHVGEVVRRDSIGLGTVDRLDGEVVVLDGRPYRVGLDGRPRLLSGDRDTPFLQAVAFHPQSSRRIPAGTSCAALLPWVNRVAGSSSGVVAVRVSGSFSALVTRSVPAQPQGTPLSAAVAKQRVFDLGASSATLVGFRTGPDASGLSPVGLHLHGLTARRTAGGHVLSCVVANAVLQVQRTRGVQLLAP